MSPMLKTSTTGRTLLIFGTKAGDVLALDPGKRGEPVWRVDISTPSATGTGRTAAAGGYRGPIWGDALDGAYAYVGCGEGAIAALRLADGKRKWCAPLDATPSNKLTYSAALTVIPGVLFAAGSDGRLWALSSDDGHSLWSFETAHSFDTVNGVPARGGSIASAGATVAGGMLFVGSGYGVIFETPGNVLLAFSVQ